MTNETKLFPIPVSSETGFPNVGDLVKALDNLNERLEVLENNPMSARGEFSGGDVLSLADRTLLNEVGDFLGVHRTVANTVQSKAEGVTDIDPLTGLPRVIRPPAVQTAAVDLPQTGS